MIRPARAPLAASPSSAALLPTPFSLGALAVVAVVVGSLGLSACRGRSVSRDREGPPRADSSSARGPRTPSLLGGERGLDHLGVAVRDLDAAASSFREHLGFGPMRRGKLPNGIQNANFYFEDGTYLELVTPWDVARVPWLSGFLEKQEGGLFLFLSVDSAEETRRFLEARGIATDAPVDGTLAGEGTGGGPAPKALWRSLFVRGTPLPGGTISFIAYERSLREATRRKLEDDRTRRRLLTHPNGVLGIRAVWMAVRDLAAARAAYARIGLSSIRTVEDVALGAKGCEVRIGIGSLLLLESAAQSGPLFEFLARRGEGILGATFTVRSLEIARKIVEKDGPNGPPTVVVDGFFGKSLRTAPERAFGLRVEMVEREAR